MTPRGIRNNNPLNIRIGNSWKGEVQYPSDREFEQFISLFYGLRAAFYLLRRYMLRYHLLTISEIVSRWAPETENATRAYITQVATYTGFPKDMILSWYEVGYMVPLVLAMARVECGGYRLDYNAVTEAYYAVCDEFKDKVKVKGS